MYIRPKFKKGDKVRVRNLTSPYKGSVGVVTKDALREEIGFFSYIVEFEWEGRARVNSFVEQELERVK